jgi:hypothetical protein
LYYVRVTPSKTAAHACNAGQWIEAGSVRVVCCGVTHSAERNQIKEKGRIFTRPSKEPQTTPAHKSRPAAFFKLKFHPTGCVYLSGAPDQKLVYGGASGGADWAHDSSRGPLSATTSPLHRLHSPRLPPPRMKSRKAAAPLLGAASHRVGAHVGVKLVPSRRFPPLCAPSPSFSRPLSAIKCSAPRH